MHRSGYIYTGVRTILCSRSERSADYTEIWLSRLSRPQIWLSRPHTTRLGGAVYLNINLIIYSDSARVHQLPDYTHTYIPSRQQECARLCVVSAMAPRAGHLNGDAGGCAKRWGGGARPFLARSYWRDWSQRGPTVEPRPVPVFFLKNKNSARSVHISVSIVRGTSRGTSLWHTNGRT
eukprot:SAG31_NODE_1166_length_9575_cov_7.039996_1_plen_178_part_00